MYYLVLLLPSAHHLVVGRRMRNEVDLVIFTHFSESPTSELCPIVCDYVLGDLESGYHLTLYKLCIDLLCNVLNKVCLYPFHEIVHYHEQEAYLTC